MNGRPRIELLSRGILVLAGCAFLVSAIANFGLRLELGPIHLGFPDPVWQAALGETVIGIVLVGAGVADRARMAWTGLLLAVAGIWVGLSSSRVTGPARDYHVALVSVTILAAVLLAVRSLRERARHPEWEPAAPHAESAAGQRDAWASGLPLGLLLTGEALAFWLSALVHFGVVSFPLGPWLVRDPFPGAAPPEAVIAMMLTLAAAAVVWHVSRAWETALGATLFAGALTLYGLTITSRSGRAGDVVFHVSMLAALAVTVVLLIAPWLRHPRQRW